MNEPYVLFREIAGNLFKIVVEAGYLLNNFANYLLKGIFLYFTTSSHSAFCNFEDIKEKFIKASFYFFQLSENIVFELSFFQEINHDACIFTKILTEKTVSF